MTNELKQRLVGAGVLLILAGILWPVLFDFDQTLVSEPPASLIPAQPELGRPELARADPGALDQTQWWQQSVLIPQFLLLEGWAIDTFSDLSAWRGRLLGA